MPNYSLSSSGHTQSPTMGVVCGKFDQWRVRVACMLLLNKQTTAGRDAGPQQLVGIGQQQLINCWDILHPAHCPWYCTDRSNCFNIINKKNPVDLYVTRNKIKITNQIDTVEKNYFQQCLDILVQCNYAKKNKFITTMSRYCII